LARSLGVKEEIILENNDNIKNIITSKFKDKLWDDNELEGKRKLRYYKEVINPNLVTNFFFSLTSAKKKMSIAKIKLILLNFKVKLSDS